MDYEREPDSGLGGESSESETPATADGAAAPANEAGTTEGSSPEVTDAAAVAADASLSDAAAEQATDDGMPEAPEVAAADTGNSDLGSDADIMNDAFSTSPAPPEWPVADFVAADSSTTDEADANIAALYASASDEPGDLGDDSDAPILEEAAASEPVPAAAVPVMDDNVRAENVNLSQGGIQSIQASSVTLSQGGAGQVHADEMTVEQGGVGLARVGNLRLGNGASAFAVVADQVTVEEGSNTFLVISRTFNGDVRPTIDWRTALAFGAGLGVILSILRRHR